MNRSYRYSCNNDEKISETKFNKNANKIKTVNLKNIELADVLKKIR